MAERGDPFVDHIPQAHGQVVAVPAVDGDALKAVAVMRARLRAGAVVARLAHLLQEFLLDLPGFLLFPLAVQPVLQDGQFVAVDFHDFLPRLLLFLSG